jgi:hypothetical protein
MYLKLDTLSSYHEREWQNFYEHEFPVAHLP